jgi:polar amino acid transport system permease protein
MAAQPPAPSADALVRPRRRWTPTVPSAPFGWAGSALTVALVTGAAALATVVAIEQALVSLEVSSATLRVALYLLGAATFLLLFPALRSLSATRRAQALATTDVAEARVLAAAAQTGAWYTFGYAGGVILILLAAHFVIANDLAVGRTFFYLPLIRDSFGLILKAFWVNVEIFCIAQVLVLIWGLVVALARLAPGAPGRPLRVMATVYVDVFRALPAIISIYLVGFGLPLTGLPLVRDLPPNWLAILALTLTYGAYVAEVYRAGIESIHPSQIAAARSLGLSYLQTMRFVVVPQAVRRIIPPLLNDFISLQKDTALVNVIGAIDAFNQAKIVASNHFNLSSVTTVAFLFILITIPQARFVDRLIERDQRRMRTGG